MDNSITIGKKTYPITEKDLEQADLKFYIENPRIYSLVTKTFDNPTQDEIEMILSKADDLKELEYSIGQNGGLIEPLIVKDGDMTVLEGNRRLAAYRNLYKKDPITFAKVKCKILPKDISEEAIFTLLGQIHIVGRKDWSPFEQAGYLYRMVKTAGKDIITISKSLGITEANAKNLIRNYEFMVEKNDIIPEHWSYYDEYLKSQSIKNYRKTLPDLDDKFASMVKNNEILVASDVRKLAAIAKNPDKSAKKIMNAISTGETSIYDGYNKIEENGTNVKAYQTLNAFRKKFDTDDFARDLAMTKNGNVKYELEKLLHRVQSLLKKYK